MLLARKMADRRLNSLDVASWRKQVKVTGSCKALTIECAQEIASQNVLNAFVTITSERAIAQSERSDERAARGIAGPLEGVPVAVKDNYCTFDIQTTAGSRILEGFVPPYESFVTRRLLEAGAVFLGKTNMDEFGMGSSTENSAFGPTLNPRGLALGYKNLVPGGSSGGSAAAVAADLCLGSVATDTGGSIRQPAGFCGVVGFKPSYGVCSRWGIVAYASSLDQAGVITKTVQDAAILMDVIAGNDPMDSTSLDTALEFESSLECVGAGFTVGIPRQFRDLEINADLSALWTTIEKAVAAAGGIIRLVDLPTVRHSLPAYYIIALSEASSNLARYDGVRYGYRSHNAHTIREMYEATRAEGFGKETRKRIIVGTYCLSAGYYDAYYLKAQKVRRKIADEFASAFDSVDFLCWPTAPTAAFAFGAHDKDPVSMYLEDVFTVPVNLAGLPAVSIPIFNAGNGMPMGTQLIGRQLSDVHLLSAAHRIHKYAA